MRHHSLRLVISVNMLLLLYTVSFGNSASAHVLKQDNGVSAVLHIAPFDAPVSKRATRIELEFGNTAGDFSLNNYKLQLQLEENGHLLHTYSVKPAYSGTSTLGVVTVVFPRADVYRLNLTSLPSGTVPAFALSYNVRVTAGATTTSLQQRSSQVVVVWAVGATMFSILMLVAVRQIIAGKRYVVGPLQKSKGKKHA